MKKHTFRIQSEFIIYASLLLKKANEHTLNYDQYGYERTMHAPDWWKDLSGAAQAAYIREHPGSVLKPTHKPENNNISHKDHIQTIDQKIIEHARNLIKNKYPSLQGEPTLKNIRTNSAGRDYVFEHISPEGTRSDISFFTNGVANIDPNRSDHGMLLSSKPETKADRDEAARKKHEILNKSNADLVQALTQFPENDDSDDSDELREEFGRRVAPWHLRQYDENYADIPEAKDRFDNESEKNLNEIYAFAHKNPKCKDRLLEELVTTQASAEYHVEYDSKTNTVEFGDIDGVNLEDQIMTAQLDRINDFFKNLDRKKPEMLFEGMTLREYQDEMGFEPEFEEPKFMKLHKNDENLDHDDTEGRHSIDDLLD